MEGMLSGAAARTGNFRIRKEIGILKKGIRALYKKQQRRIMGDQRKLGYIIRMQVAGTVLNTGKAYKSSMNILQHEAHLILEKELLEKGRECGGVVKMLNVWSCSEDR